MAGNKPGPEKGDPRMIECGKLGGQKVLKRYGREFFQEIGRKGGQSTKSKYGPEFYSYIGKKSGFALKEKLGHKKDARP